MKKKTIRKVLLFLLIFTFFYPTLRVNEGHLNATSHNNGIYKAITYNIHRGTTKSNTPSLNRIIELLDKEDADFIALQEVDRYKARSGFQDQISEIAQSLNMDSIFIPNIKGTFSEYGNAILSRYPILESGKIDFKVGKEPRSLLWAKVKTEHGEIYLTSIHLGTETRQRAQYFARLEEFMESKKDETLLIMGDFNILPNHDALQSFHFHVTGNVYQQEIPTFKVENREVQIDYIMGRGIRNLNLFTIPSNASDHYPLILQFRFEKTNGTDLRHELIKFRA